jgi:hypothetical protein
MESALDMENSREAVSSSLSVVKLFRLLPRKVTGFKKLDSSVTPPT